MIGSIIGAVGGVIGSVVAGHNSAKARKRQQAILDGQAQRATNVYNRDYYKDYTQTASSQAALNNARNIYNEGIARANAAKAVSGGTEESVASAKQQANNAVADATTNIAIQGEQSSQRASDNYQSAMNAVDNAKANMEAQTASEQAKAGSEAIKAGVGMAQADADANGNLVGNMFGFNERKKK